MNQLAQAQSAYLRQHAHHPVHWQTWGPEALEQARSEDKPIILSIGYATCHWCHVMARESFEDKQIADYMNTHFVNIKVDREERPDLDQLYMDAARRLNRSSGWPLNCFLTPDGRPFHAGTYFPPEPRGKQTSWWEALQFALYNFKENRPAVELQGDRAFQALENPLPPEPKTTEVNLSTYFDRENGGFGGAPKYPDLLLLRYLLHHAYFSEDQETLPHLRFTVGKISHGGIYDLLAGGIARYAVDPAWALPHFEKMLYDNALWIDLLADLYRLAPDEEIKHLLLQSLHFIQAFQHAGGAYASAMDADTEGEEGKYYRWEQSEIETLLGTEATVFFQHYYLQDGVLQRHWQGKRLPRSIEQLALARQKRVAPQLDPKIHLGWNALLVSALLKSSSSLGASTWQKEAENLLHLLLETGFPDRLPHVLHQSQAAFLSDYAFLIQACLDQYESDYQPEWLDRADQLTQVAVRQFSAPDEIAFLQANQSQSDLPLNRPEWEDLEVPSGNSVMALNLWRLGLLLGRPAYLHRAEQLIETGRSRALQKPLAHPQWLILLALQKKGMDEIAVIGPEFRVTANAIRDRFYPEKVLLALPDANERYPLSQDRPAEGKTRIYRCHNYACQRPVDNLLDFWKNKEQQV